MDLRSGDCIRVNMDMIVNSYIIFIYKNITFTYKRLLRQICALHNVEAEFQSHSGERELLRACVLLFIVEKVGLELKRDDWEKRMSDLTTVPMINDQSYQQLVALIEGFVKREPPRNMKRRFFEFYAARASLFEAKYLYNYPLLVKYIGHLKQVVATLSVKKTAVAKSTEPVEDHNGNAIHTDLANVAASIATTTSVESPVYSAGGASINSAPIGVTESTSHQVLNSPDSILRAYLLTNTYPNGYSNCMASSPTSNTTSYLEHLPDNQPCSGQNKRKRVPSIDGPLDKRTRLTCPVVRDGNIVGNQLNIVNAVYPTNSGYPSNPGTIGSNGNQNNNHHTAINGTHIIQKHPANGHLMNSNDSAKSSANNLCSTGNWIKYIVKYGEVRRVNLVFQALNIDNKHLKMAFTNVT